MKYTPLSLIRRLNRMKPLTKLLVLISLAIEALTFYFFIYKDEFQVATLTESSNEITYSHLIDILNGEEFARQPMVDRCKTYFDELYRYDLDWKIGNFDGTQYLVPLAKDKSRYERELLRYRRKGIRRLTKLQRQEMRNEVSQQVAKLLENNLNIESMIYDSIGHLKIFGKCLLDHSMNLMKYSAIEQRLFPWLTRKLPVYKRWDGTVIDDRIPNIDSFTNELVQDNNKTYDTNESFITYFHNNMHGKGVVLSVSDLQVNNTVSLIRVLRFLQNEVPIQLVHKGDLSTASQNKLISLARNEIVVLDRGVNLKEYRQELWFVDASHCIQPEYLLNFEQYLNKWLAVLFNSFDEIMILDDDSIPFVAPNTFFQLPKFQKYGSVFYRDREIDVKMEQNFHNLYISLLPSIHDEKFFEINRLSNDVAQFKFFTQSSRHQMESGLVVIKRRSHFTGLLISTHLQIWTPTSTPVHGDKELFWLGQVMAGSAIAFNDLPLGASGYLENFAFANELCSIQPSHVHDDGHTLLWVNSGLSQCKYNTWEDDIKLPYYSDYNTTESLHDFLKSPLIINSVIIPPDETLHFPNSEKKPVKGWQKRNDMGCMQYYFCAFDKVGGSLEKDHKSFGKLVRYNEEEQSKLLDVAKVWNWN